MTADTAPLPASGPNPVCAEDWAVLVAITGYPGLGDLQGCANDADEFEAWLLDPRGGGLPKSQVFRVETLAAQPKTRPKEGDLIEVFENHIIDPANGTTDGRLGRRLYVYMAGHGMAPTVDDAALLMANASRNRLGHHFPARPYANWFRTSGLFDEFVLFMDCCRDDHPLIPPNPVRWDPRRGPEARHLFGFATRWSRKSRERADTTGRIRGLFTRALLEGLRGARDPQGRITAASVEGYVFARLKQLLGDEPYQEPQFDYEKQRDFVIVPARGQPAASAGPTLCRATIRFTAPPPASASILDSGFATVATAAPVPQPWMCDLPHAKYLVVEDGGSRRQPFDALGGSVDVLV